MLEKERKFLPKKDFNILKYKEESIPIKQAYLMLGKNGKQLRIRYINDSPFICYKYKISNNIKEEFEYYLNDYNKEETQKLYDSAELKLEKDRAHILIKGNNYTDWEIIADIDFYKNGLTVIEVEYTCSDEILEEYLKISPLKEMLGKEITGNKRYSNVQLAKKFTNKKQL